jgi:hypothetical protein
MDHFVPTSYPTPESGNGAAPERPDYQQGNVHFENLQTEHAKKRQKRNKPTLSCEECVGRKTKVRDIIYVIQSFIYCFGVGWRTQCCSIARLARTYLSQMHYDSIS